VAKKADGAGEKPAPQTPRQRKQKERAANTAHLAAHGWDGDPESFVVAWRRGAIAVRWERVEDGKDKENAD
jgi:hypothetical protein